MAVRKTQKKHLGKKRKSLSKRKAHSKKKRHSKQRITKKRSHKGGGDDDMKPAEEAKVAEKAKVAEEASGAEKASGAKEAYTISTTNALNRYFKKALGRIGGGKAHSKKRITKKRYHKGGDTLTSEEIYIINLKGYINGNCPDEALIKRLIDCIDGKKIDDYFDDNNSTEDMVEFIKDLRKKIKYAPNKELKNKLIGCVDIATRESPPNTISG
jgi:hypothetical protein